MRDRLSFRLAFIGGGAALLFGLFMAALTPPEHRLVSVMSGTGGGLTVSYLVAAARTWQPTLYFSFGPRAREREDEPPFVRLPRKRSVEGGQ